MRSFRYIIIILSWAFCTSAAADSALSRAAEKLATGESVRIPTSLPGKVLSPPEDGSNFLQWGNSGVWDPVRKEVRFIGKRHGRSAPYRFLTYDVASDSWNIDREPPESPGTPGHGYDHNTVDPGTGDHYYRLYGSRIIRKWNGDWSALPAMPREDSVAATISYMDGFGLVYADRGSVRRLVGSSWETILDSPPNFGLHPVSEYNPVAGMLVIAGGDKLPRSVLRLDTRGKLSRGAPAPFKIGSATDASVLVADPASASLVAWNKSGKGWAEYEIGADRWFALQQSTGDGSAPQPGTPNLAVGKTAHAVIGIPIDDYGVMMFVQFLGPDTPAGVWLYRHSPDLRRPIPDSPTLFSDGLN